MPGGLDKLPEDLLLQILFLTDIYTVLTISQVNTFFHAVASTKQLWLLLTRDLFLRGLIDIPSDEVNLTLSSDKLIAQMKRAARRPRTWSPDSPTAPTVIKRFTIQLENHAVVFHSLLPGGRYIVFQGRGAVECYKVSTGRRVWSWDRPNARVCEMYFSGCRGHKVTAFLTVAAMGPLDLRLVVFEVDLESGNSRETLRFPSARVDALYLRNPQSAEGYLGCLMLSPRNNAPGRRKMPFLINLQTEQYIFLDYELTTTKDLHIIPGHVLLISPPSEPLSVRVYSVLSLERFWRPLSDFDLENATSESMIASATVPLEGGVRQGDNTSSTRQVEVSVTASLLRQNTYLLRVFDTVRYTGTSTRAVSTHRLDLSEQTPQCTLISTFTRSMDETMRMSAVSRAGHSVLSSSKVGFRLVQQDDTEETFINFETVHPRSPSQVALPHNGGLVIVHETHAELLYYD